MRLLAALGELLTIKGNAVLWMGPVETSLELKLLPSTLQISCRVLHRLCKKKNNKTQKKHPPKNSRNGKHFAVAGQHSVSNLTTAKQTGALEGLKKRNKGKTQMAKEINRLPVAVHDLSYCPLVCLTSILIPLSTVCQPRVAAANSRLLCRPPASPLGEGYIGGSAGEAAACQVSAPGPITLFGEPHFSR